MMAFFSDGSTNYFSLSLHPTGEPKVYVFRLTAAQVSRASAPLPICFAVGILGIALVTALGITDHVSYLRDLIRDGQKTALLLASAGAALLASLTGLSCL